jgi:photosystem II stability/assembly factor-like uncharacterized protein
MLRKLMRCGIATAMLFTAFGHASNHAESSWDASYLRQADKGFTSLSFISPLDGCAAMDFRILCTADGGSAWHLRYIAQTPITQLQLVSAKAGWAVADNTVLGTLDDGQRWQVLSHLANLSMVDFLTPSLGWAIAGRYLEVTHNGGVQWRVTPLDAAIRAIAFRTAHDGWALTDTGQVISTTTGGESWIVEVQIPASAEWLAGTAELRFTSFTRGWLVLTSGQACAGQEPYAVYETNNSGHQWHLRLQGPSACPGGGRGGALLGPPGYFAGFAAVGSHIAWLAVANPTTATLSVLTTSTDGQHWSRSDSFADACPQLNTSGTLVFVSRQQGWLATSNLADCHLPWHILHTTDGGRTWRSQYPPSGASRAE